MPWLDTIAVMLYLAQGRQGNREADANKECDGDRRIERPAERHRERDGDTDREMD